jgi:hypothetical protein
MSGFRESVVGAGLAVLGWLKMTVKHGIFGVAAEVPVGFGLVVLDQSWFALGLRSGNLFD